MLRSCWVYLLVGLLGLLVIAPVGAHELPENRATLVLRDDLHLTLTFYVDYPDLLHKTLAPKQNHREFLLAYSAMQPEVFHQQMLRAQAEVQAATRAILNDDKSTPITGWVWPSSALTQKQIQQEVMAAMVGAGPHAHEAPTEIRAHITHQQPIKTAKIQFADGFGKLLLVYYRPKQQWATPKQALRVQF